MKDRLKICLLLFLLLAGIAFLWVFFLLQTHSRTNGYSAIFSHGSEITHVSPTFVTLATPININTASTEQLQTLPGIGPGLANKIVAYREEHGPFEAVAELSKVSGIGVNRLEVLLDYITTGG